MEELAGELRRLCRASGENNTVLARRAGIDRPTLLHILAGRRRPTAAQLEALLGAMQATPAQQLALKQQFNLESVAPGLRYQRDCVLQMLKKLFTMQENIIAPVLLPQTPGLAAGLKAESQQLFQGTPRVVATLQQLLLDYCAAPTGPLMLPPGLSAEQLALVGDLLAHCPGAGEIWHLSTFVKHTDSREEARHNLENFSRAIPFAYLDRIRYRAAFSYTEGTEQQPGLLFVSYLLFPDSLLAFSRDGRMALLVNDPLVVASCRRCFEEDFRVARGFLEMDSSLQHRAQDCLQANSEMDRQCQKTWVFRYEPELICYLDPAMAERLMTVPPEAAELRALILRRLRETCALPLTAYFTVAGIKKFLADGRASEIPSEIYRPLEMSDRLELLNRMIAAFEENKGQFYLLNPQRLNPPRDFYMTVAQNISARFYLLNEKADRVFSFSEAATLEAICDFLDNLPNTDCVYSRAHTQEILYALREQTVRAIEATPEATPEANAARL